MNKSLRSCSQIIGHWETFPLCPMFVFNKLFTKSFQIFHYNCLIPFHCKLHPSIKGPGHFLRFYANFSKWLSLSLSFTFVHCPAFYRLSLPHRTTGVPLINKQLLLFFSKPMSQSVKDLEMIIVNPNKTLFQTSSNFSSLQPVKLLLPPFPLLLENKLS